FRLDFWLAKEAVESLLKLAIVFEMAVRVLGRLPTARAAFAALFLLALLAIAGAVGPTVGADVQTVAQDGLPRLLYGTALLFAALLGACLWYHVPLYPMHKAILVGFVVYLLVFTVVLQVLQTLGWVARGPANVLNSVAFISLLAFWARSAWQPFRTGDASPA